MLVPGFLESQADYTKKGALIESDVEMLYFSECFPVRGYVELFAALGFILLQKQSSRQDYHNSFRECLSPICFLLLFRIRILC